MIAFEEARARVLQSVTPMLQSEMVPVHEALGRVLGQGAVAEFAVPNHDNSAMDGYGIRHADLHPQDAVTLHVCADLPAGDRLSQAIGAGQAVRIMTGAPIPAGVDCVVMQEVVQRVGDQVTIPAGQALGQNIRPAGEDIAKGALYLNKGVRLTPAQLGLLTSMGQTSVAVFKRPRVAVLSTGNEVVRVGNPLRPGQVYDSNRTTLLTALQALGVEVVDLGLVRDDRAAIREALERGASQADAVISSGGVSVGDYDLVKAVLQELGQIDFWKVNMKPGKPQAYGTLGQARFFGLPGNPVSALAVFLLVVRPALLKMMGVAEYVPPLLRLPLLEGRLRKKNNRVDFQRGLIRYDAQQPGVVSTGGQGSGMLSSMAAADCFIVLPAEAVDYAPGELVTVQRIDY
ncbi:molybdopterin molybdochelatase [Magnetococcus marinus MC-1]|uniref:Molybdopterin molybdenumtransferase n=1 Tax=Magnetococcus marinus (strain ATCC BAA-1437 / JCM 17883 / MC-1) TaxID=156889 RepID=A0L7R2_MAGMM|nr:gephyrin-like molybdotransferase Glp [Magnetococcus marinus]ABK44005.1 molybdopterin molybdochelatase [Magnetococcus marinus MC-1]